MRKQTKQMGLADGLVNRNAGFVDKADSLVDWAWLEKELSGIYASETGRPSYPPLVLFKSLILQQWYGLSDPAMEEALSDRISFRRFVGLSLSDTVPDHSTISRFRSRLAGRMDRLMSALNAQFEKKGLIIKRGTMLDASFVKTARTKDGADPDAGRYGRPYKEEDGKASKAPVCGYKMHVGTDQGSGIVRKLILTPANVNDTTVADDLIMGDEAAVYADKAYDKDERRQRLEDAGVFAGLMRRPGPWRPLTREQVEFNKKMAPLRAPVERVFATLKNYYRLRRARYTGLARVTVQVALAALAMNIKRALVLSVA